MDPIKLVVWLPALCRKMEIPYCIVKGKARLGAIVHKKFASVLCLTNVKNEDKSEFSRILKAIKANFNDKYDENRKSVGCTQFEMARKQHRQQTTPYHLYNSHVK